MDLICSKLNTTESLFRCVSICTTGDAHITRARSLRWIGKRDSILSISDGLIDQEGIHGAKLWSQEIVNAIESSKVFILFASAKAFLSKNVTKELALASESDKHILPIFIEDAEIPAAMKYQLAGIQHLVHEQGQTDQTADNILRTLGNLDPGPLLAAH